MCLRCLNIPALARKSFPCFCLRSSVSNTLLTTTFLLSTRDDFDKVPDYLITGECVHLRLHYNLRKSANLLISNIDRCFTGFVLVILGANNFNSSNLSSWNNEFGFPVSICSATFESKIFVYPPVTGIFGKVVFSFETGCRSLELYLFWIRIPTVIIYHTWQLFRVPRTDLTRYSPLWSIPAQAPASTPCLRLVSFVSSTFVTSTYFNICIIKYRTISPVTESCSVSSCGIAPNRSIRWIWISTIVGIQTLIRIFDWIKFFFSCLSPFFIPALASDTSDCLLLVSSVPLTFRAATFFSGILNCIWQFKNVVTAVISYTVGALQRFTLCLACRVSSICSYNGSCPHMVMSINNNIDEIERLILSAGYNSNIISSSITVINITFALLHLLRERTTQSVTNVYFRILRSIHQRSS